MSDSADSLAEQESRVSRLVETEFRTLTTRSGRKGIRLEKIFWDALNLLSTDAGQKRSRFVGDIVEEAQGEGVNATSAIRCATIDLLMQDLLRLRPLANTSNVIRLLQAGPAPSFALDRRKRLVQANAEFLRYMRSVGGGLGATTPVDGAQLSLERPLETLFEELASGGTGECGISIRVGNRDRRTSARLLLVPPAPASVLVGYVLS